MLSNAQGGSNGGKWASITRMSASSGGIVRTRALPMRVSTTPLISQELTGGSGGRSVLWAQTDGGQS